MILVSSLTSSIRSINKEQIVDYILLSLVGRFVLSGVPKVNKHIRPLQQGLDQGEDLHPVEEAGQQGKLVPIRLTLSSGEIFSVLSFQVIAP